MGLCDEKIKFRRLFEKRMFTRKKLKTQRGLLKISLAQRYNNFKIIKLCDEKRKFMRLFEKRSFTGKKLNSRGFTEIFPCAKTSTPEK